MYSGWSACGRWRTYAHAWPLKRLEELAYWSKWSLRGNADSECVAFWDAVATAAGPRVDAHGA